MLTKENIRTAGSIAGILTLLGGIVWFAADLNSRLVQVEERLHTLTVAPAIANAANGRVTGNPIAQACADLARQVTKEADGGSYSRLTEAKDLIEKLGCSSATSSSQ